MQGLDFTYDGAADRLADITNNLHPSLSQTFTYDAVGRLTQVASSSGNQSYVYDANGNRTTQEMDGVATPLVIQPGSNRLASVGGQAIGYDANGNTTTVGGVVKYHYDSFNRLESAGGATFYVNPEGQRLRKSGPAGTTYFAPDRSGPLLADEPDGVWKDYVWMGGRMVGMITNNTVYALHSDQTGRVLVITNSSGAVAWEAEGLAFHRHTTSGSTAFFRLGFPGQYWDVEDSLWHNGFRDYDPTLGRYIESDPLGLGGGMNTYAYVTSNPIMEVDRLGLEGVGSWNNGGYKTVIETHDAGCFEKVLFNSLLNITPGVGIVKSIFEGVSNFDVISATASTSSGIVNYGVGRANRIRQERLASIKSMSRNRREQAWIVKSMEADKAMLQGVKLLGHALGVASVGIEAVNFVHNLKSKCGCQK